MLNNYLQFAKTQVKEETTQIEVRKFFKELLMKYNNDNISLKIFNTDVFFKARSSALTRCFNNIIQNGLSYGENVYIHIQKNLNDQDRK